MAKNTDVEAVVIPEQIVLDATQFKKVRGGSSSTWRSSIIAHLKDNQGCDEQSLYTSTYTGNKWTDEPNKVRHNLASQFTYMRDDGYAVVKEDGKVFLLTEPNPGKKGTYLVIKGQESRARRLL